MKKIIVSVIFLSFLGCKEEKITPSVGLNGTFEGTTSGWSQPVTFSEQNTWTVYHQGNEITAIRDNNSNNPDAIKFTIKGTITSDSTLTGVVSSFPVYYKVKGKFSKDMNKLYFESSDNGELSNYFRFKSDLTRKP